MTKNELIIVIAVLLVLTIIMIWWGLKTMKDMHRRKKEMDQRWKNLGEHRPK